MAQQLPQQQQPIADPKGFVTRAWFLFFNSIARQVIGSTTFAALPANPETGQLAVVTNSSVTTWGAAVAGGGASTVLVWYNGTDFTVIGA